MVRCTLDSVKKNGEADTPLLVQQPVVSRVARAMSRDSHVVWAIPRHSCWVQASVA
jgi:hypothetical protein